MKGFSLISVSLVMVAGASTLLADTVFYTNEADWLAAVSGVEYFDTTESNIGLANEALPSSVLTFDAANTGLSRSFDVRALQSGGQFFHSTNPNQTDRAGIYVGPDPTYEDDDWEINMLGGPSLTGFAFFLVGNRTNVPVQPEAFEVFGLDGTSLGRKDDGIPTSNGSEGLFLGVLTTEPIGRIFFDEDSTDDDIIIADFRFVPEPTTLSLLALAGLVFVRRRTV